MADSARTLDRPDAVATRLVVLRRLARWLDAAIPVPFTGRRIGLDPVIGLVPGLGDAIGLVMGLWIFAEAAGLGASKTTLTRMVVNLVIDALAGAVPVVGDVYDAARQSNLRNLALLERHLEDPSGTARASGRVLALLGGAVVAATGAALVGGFLLARWLVLLLTG